MQFEYNEIQNEIRNLAQKFSESEIKPIVETDEENAIFKPDIIKKLGHLGLTGIPIPEKFGGAGLGYQEYVLALEEIAKHSASYAISVAVSGLPQIILNKFGTEEQKSKYIQPLAKGQHIGAFSLSEASSGSDASSLLTTAEKKNDCYVLNGTKMWTTQGDSADTIIVLARTGGPGAKGISAFIVEKGMKGFQTGKQEKKMGANISHTMELLFDQVKVPESHRIGKEGEGFKIALTALDSGRITIAACALGIAKAALSIAIQHSKERTQFGKPIASFQGPSFMLADMQTLIDASELLIQKAAWYLDQNLPFTQYAAQAKLYATDMAMKVTTDAVQILGGSGYTKEFPLERYMREAKVLQIVEGTNQIQRLVIGQIITGIKAL